jgi:hypothetical protein
MSLGGARVYSDELFSVGDRIEMEILLPDTPPIEIVARAVRVHILPPSAPAFCDVAVEFVSMTSEAERILEAELGVARASAHDGAPACAPPSSGARAACASQPRVYEHYCEEVGDVEDQHSEERLGEPAPGAPFARRPQGDRHVREQDGDQNELLHRPAP